MDPFTVTLARKLADTILEGADDRLKLDRETSPEVFVRLVDELSDGSDATTWVFTDRDLHMQGRALAINAYPWGETEARLTKTPVANQPEAVSSAIANLRAIQF